MAGLTQQNLVTLREARRALGGRHPGLDRRIRLRLDGGPGSGNHGHKGIPGHQGGSAPEGGSKGGSGGNAGKAASEKYGAGKPKEKSSVQKPHITAEAMKEGEEKAAQCRAYDPSKVPDLPHKGVTLTSWSKEGDLFSESIQDDGTLTPEREKLHREIINKHFEGVTPAEGKPVYTMLGGGPASGKSTLRRSGMVDIEENSVTVDCDGIKDMLPEYQAMCSMNDSTAARYCHSESSSLAERIRRVGMDSGYNVVDDGTGNGSVWDIVHKISQAHAAGQKVSGVYCTVPTDVALKRAAQRAKETGREVPESVIRKAHISVSRDLPQVADQFDDVVVYDMSGDVPVLIAKGGGGKKLQCIPGQEKLFEAFLAKANEPMPEEN